MVTARREEYTILDLFGLQTFNASGSVQGKLTDLVAVPRRAPAEVM